MSELLELADRCEKAEGLAQPTLLRAAFEAIHGPKPERLLGGSSELDAYLRALNPFVGFLNAKAFLDAAMTLVPEGWHVTHSGEGRFLTRGSFVTTLETWGVEQADDGSDIHTTPQRRNGVAETFPLAICAAALRASASKEQSK